jgi:hypothetical protein
MNSR